MPATRLAIIGAGDRARHLLEQIYRIRDRRYPYDPAGNWSIVGEDSYQKYSDELLKWAERIEDIQPEVVAIFDPNVKARQRLGEFCREHGDDPDSNESFERLLTDASFDTAIIASPNHAHVEQALALLDHDINTFCEKPIGVTLDEHDKLIQADDRSDTLFYIGFNLRVHPVYARIAELIKNNEIGDLGMITSHNVRVPFPTGFRYSEDRSGGTLLEKNCHDFDLYNWYIDAHPVRVAAIGGQRIFSKGTDVLDHASVLVEYKNGVKATLELSLFSPFTQQRNRSYFLRGSEGTIRTPDVPDELEIFKRTTKKCISVRAHRRNAAEGGHGGADYRQMMRFFRYLEGEATRPATTVDAKKAAAIAVAAQESIKHDRFYSIDTDYQVKPA